MQSRFLVEGLHSDVHGGETGRHGQPEKAPWFGKAFIADIGRGPQQTASMR
jgi:hypothetical protein